MLRSAALSSGEKSPFALLKLKSVAWQSIFKKGCFTNVAADECEYESLRWPGVAAAAVTDREAAVSSPTHQQLFLWDVSCQRENTNSYGGANPSSIFERSLC